MSNNRLWSFVADMNNSGNVTISDVWLWLKWLYFYPGDLILKATMTLTPKVANFIELDAGSYGGTLSGVISFFSIFLFILLLEALSLDKFLISFIGGLKIRFQEIISLSLSIFLPIVLISIVLALVGMLMSEFG